MNRLHNKATFAAQKNFSSACFFMPFYLVNPNKSVTHTHTQGMLLLRQNRDKKSMSLWETMYLLELQVKKQSLPS